jgi:hypothetical protein
MFPAACFFQAAQCQNFAHVKIGIFVHVYVCIRASLQFRKTKSALLLLRSTEVAIMAIQRQNMLQ